MKKKLPPRQVLFNPEAAKVNGLKNAPVVTRSLSPNNGVWWYRSWNGAILFPDTSIEELIKSGSAQAL